ncbi:MAG TPA: SRPBCC family protein [Ktedonosporobacter sp.]|nr:SRPBCC family protein [Ktedonosporobacter sp.]
MHSFDDVIEIAAPVEVVYQYIFAADHWPRLLPHVVNVTLQTDAQGEQLLAMQTRVNDQIVETRSVRRCTPYQEITFSQITMPPWMNVHEGVWLFRSSDTGTQLQVCHTVEVNEGRLDQIFGAPRTLPEAYAIVSAALARNSRTTMLAVKEMAEHSHIQ